MGYDIEERLLVNKELRFKLTEHDFAERGKEASQISKDLDAYRLESKQIRAERTEKEKALESSLSHTLGIISEGHEVRQTNCKEVRNFTLNKVEYVVDGIVIEDRPLSSEERQREMQLIDGNGGKVVQGDFKKAAAGDKDGDGEEDADFVPEGPEPVECAKENALTDEEE